MMAVMVGAWGGVQPAATASRFRLRVFHVGVCFDAAGNSISANTTWLEVCRSQVVDGVGCACPLGGAALAGNGVGPGSDEPETVPETVREPSPK